MLKTIATGELAFTDSGAIYRDGVAQPLTYTNGPASITPTSTSLPFSSRISSIGTREWMHSSETCLILLFASAGKIAVSPTTPFWHSEVTTAVTDYADTLKATLERVARDYPAVDLEPFERSA